MTIALRTDFDVMAVRGAATVGRRSMTQRAGRRPGGIGGVTLQIVQDW